MAKKSMVAKAKREPKFSTRQHNRCTRCGRPRAYYRKFGLCRVCLRELANKGATARRDQSFVVSHTTITLGCATVRRSVTAPTNRIDRLITDQRRKSL